MGQESQGCTKVGTKQTQCQQALNEGDENVPCFVYVYIFVEVFVFLCFIAGFANPVLVSATRCRGFMHN